MIRPLMQTSIDWETWNTACKEHGVEPITRSLDASGASLDQVGSVILALDRNGFRHSLDHLLRLVTIGFLLTLDDDKVKQQITLCHSGPWAEYHNQLILTGNLVEWRLSVVLGSNSSDVRVRAAYNAIYSYARHAGIQELWNDWERITLEDRTFNLKRT